MKIFQLRLDELLLILTEKSVNLHEEVFVSFVHICDLSRDNVPNASRSNAERNGKRTGDERLGKPFETGTVNG